MDLREIRWKVVDWFHAAQEWGKWPATVKPIMNLQVPKKAGNFLNR
jgi:hypothetical protein